MIYDCIIIGGGPAGLTAALYLARFNRKIILFDNNKSRASIIPISHNYPGYKHGISGNKILANLRNQLKFYRQTRIINKTVSKLINNKKNKTFTLSTSSDNTKYHAKKIILATGLIDIEPPLPKIKNAIKKGLIRHCPICDAYEVSNKKIAILCHTESSIDKAFFLKQYSNDITLFTLGKKIKLTKKTKHKIITANIRIIEDPILEVIHKKDKIKALKTSKGSHSFNSVYSALGSTLRSELAIKLGAKHTKENCLLVKNTQETSIKGLYAAGDVVKSLNQITVAMAQAAIAACSVNDELNNIHLKYGKKDF